MNRFPLCSNCFIDKGLKFSASNIGYSYEEECMNCKQVSGIKLSKDLAIQLVHDFFVKGTLFKSEYGEAPVLNFNEFQKTSVKFLEPLKSDVKLLENILGVGLFYYGPQMWTLGEIDPLNHLFKKAKRNEIAERIINEYPTKFIDQNDLFFRLRKNPSHSFKAKQYDSPPAGGSGRLDSKNFPILYGSQDLEVCIHECRVRVEDELYLATLRPKFKLKLLDLTANLQSQTMEYQDLDIAVKMLYKGENHSYHVTRYLSKKIKQADFDGIIYPSYFSKFRGKSSDIKSIYIPNIALFGRPIKMKKVEIININRLILNKIKYDYSFGPIFM